MNPLGPARRNLPLLDWRAKYTGKTFIKDLIVAGIVTVMLIPQYAGLCDAGGADGTGRHASSII